MNRSEVDKTMSLLDLGVKNRREQEQMETRDQCLWPLLLVQMDRRETEQHI